MTSNLICNRSTEQYPLNGKNRLHILNNREAYYYYIIIIIIWQIKGAKKESLVQGNKDRW